MQLRVFTFFFFFFFNKKKKLSPFGIQAIFCFTFMKLFAECPPYYYFTQEYIPTETTVLDIGGLYIYTHTHNRQKEKNPCNQQQIDKTGRTQRKIR